MVLNFLKLEEKLTREYRVYILFITFIIVSNAFSQSIRKTVNFDPVLDRQLEDKLLNLYQEKKLIGISAAVIMPDKSSWLGAQGISSAEPGDNLNPIFLFCFASNTKMFTAAAILKLAEQKKLFIGDALDKWLPKYNYVDSTITIRQLLNHTSGIYDFIKNDNYWAAVNSDILKIWNHEQVLEYIKAPYFSPGSSWKYSNTNYILLGMIIEKVTNSKLSEVFRELLFRPCNLNNTYLAVEDTIDGIVAHNWRDVQNNGYYVDLGIYNLASLYSSTWAAGAIFSTAQDMAQWAVDLFEGNVLNKETMDEMLTFIPMSLSPYYNGYGLGVLRQRLHGLEIWGHGGGTIGFNSEIIYSPQYGVSIAVVINQDGQNPVPLVAALLKVVIDHQTTDIQNSSKAAAENFILKQNYPNPFNPSTRISYSIGTPNLITLKIYDILGKEIQTLVNEVQQPSTYNINFDAGNLSSGIYFYKLRVGNDFVETKKMSLMR